MKTIGMTGKKHSIETRIKMSKSAVGNKNRFTKDRNPMNNPTFRKKVKDSKIGNKNPNWKGGVSPVNVLIRQSAEYKQWKLNVLKRDKYTCVECGLLGGKWIKDEKRKVYVHVDHIKPFAYFPELRFELSNGRTLCRECHKKTDTYGYHK